MIKRLLTLLSFALLVSGTIKASHSISLCVYGNGAPNPKPVSCNGLCDGAAKICVTGGSGNFTYQWYNPQGGPISGATTDTLSNMCVGTYLIVVTDATNGDQEFMDVIINEPSGIVELFKTITDVSCKDSCNGSIAVTVTGGTPPRTFLWSNGKTTSTITGLCAGNYTYTVTDKNSCTKAFGPHTVNTPDAIAVTINKNNESCGSACDGNAKAVVTGGNTGGYNYSWSNSATVDSIFGLCANTYGVTVTDSKNCSGTASVTITSPPALVIGKDSTNLSCNIADAACDGTITLTTSGGTSPYSYNWSDIGVSTLSTRTGLCAGTYSVTVTDAGTCSKTTSVSLIQPAALVSNIGKTDVVCNGACDGTAFANPSGGTSGYTFLWSVSSQTTDTVTSLCPNTYTVTITDSKGCKKTDNVSVVEFSVLLPNASATNVSCNGAGDGSVTANPTGGVSPYTYLWSPGGATTKTVNSLSGGNYTVTVTDANGCKKSQTVTVVNPPGIIDNFTSTNSTCFGFNNGTASVNPSGGTSPYTYLWTPGNQTTQSVSNLGPGSYTVTTFDNQGCNTTRNFAITEPAQVVPNVTTLNASCNGVCDGSASASATGGTSPYTYSWNTPGNPTTSSVTGLCAGTYSVTVTGTAGCTGTQTLTITSPTLINANAGQINPTCSGQSTGTAWVAPTGGISGYSYQWSNSATTDTIKNLTVGDYDYTVTDASNCTVFGTISIVIPNALNSNPSQTDVTCNGGSDGVASVTPTGGTPFYTYLWSTGGSLSFKSGLTAGNYTVTITDAAGCSLVEIFTIDEPAPFNISTVQNNANCTALCDGSGTVNVSGGSSPYTYQWPNSQTNATATGLCAGTYTVTVKDANNCSQTTTVTINNLVNINLSSTVVTQDCNGVGCDGTAGTKASGGTFPYTFTWSSGSVTSFPDSSVSTGLCAGTVYITVTDNIGCSDTGSVVMTVSPFVFQVTDSVVNISCNGANDGKAFALASGGITPYTYQWSTGATTSSITGLIPGNYQGVGTDAAGCKDTINVVIIDPAVLSTTVSATNINCSGNNNGVLTANPTGGTTPYSYQWGAGTGNQTTQSATGLSPGTYFVTVTDINGCIATGSGVIIQPTALSATFSMVNVDCNGNNNGSATVNPSGGVSPYSYQWGPNAFNQTTQTATGLVANTYNVTVTDFNNCTFTGSVTITQPSLLGSSITVSNVLCNGDCNGQAVANPTGGTTPYTYKWSTTPQQTTKTITGLCAGSYTVTVTDLNGCTTTATNSVSSPSALTIAVSQTNISCNGSGSGTATATPSGGVSPYIYAWSSTPQQTTQTATGLTAGTYTVTVTDVNGCSKTGTVTITQPTALAVTGTPTASNCGVCDGKAKANPTGGTPAYTYNWSNGKTTQTITGICAGIYTVTVSDNNSCTVVLNVPVSNIDGPDGATISTTNPSCFGSCDGSANVLSVIGGTSPYTYLWPAGQTTTSVTGQCADTLILEITDNISCKNYQTIILSEPAPINVSFTINNVTCNGQSNGTALANPTGGTSPYSYSWSTGATSSSISNVSAGSYFITVTDSKGCTGTSSVTIGQSTTLSTALTINNTTCNSANDGTAAVFASGGTSPYNYSWSDGQTTQSATGFVAGTYYLTTTDQNGCNKKDTVNITEPSAVTIGTTVTDATCGNSDGSITVNASGGTNPYAFTWTNPAGQTTATVTGIPAGTKTLIITDANACQTTFNIPLNNISGPTLTASGTNILCSGACTGTATVSATGGTSPYTFLWTPGNQTTSSVSGLCAGTYYVAVTDNINCTTIDSVVVSEPNEMAANFSKTNASCNGSCDGQILSVPSGGVNPYSYQWSTGSTAQSLTSLCIGTYVLTLTDGNGCTKIDSSVITQPAALVASVSGTNVTCNGSSNGSASVSASGGTPGYTYGWSNGASGAIAGSLAAGTYTVTATDANGCTTTTNVTITQPTAISLTSIPFNTTCGNCNGGITVSASGGAGPYSYLWSNGNATASNQNLCANVYALTVTDASSCNKQFSFIITNTDGPQPVATDDTVSCFSSCDAAVSVSATGGVTPYSYQWNDAGSQTNSTATGLCAGTYNIYVSDANSCIGIDTSKVTQRPQLLAVETITDPNCVTTGDVEVSLSVTGGQSPYSYNWSGGQSTATITGLTTGTYFYTITDVNLCTYTDSVVVDETNSLLLSVTSTNSNCSGSCDGTITATVTGGTSPYSYNWSDGSSASIITGICSTSLTITVTDVNGCVVNGNASVTEPAVLSTNPASTDVNCSGGTGGTASVSPTGGTSPYSYNWSFGGKTTASVTGLNPGAYAVTTTDSKGCTVVDNFTISQPSTLNLDSTQVVNTGCGVSAGSATVYVSGGTTPYSYSWSDLAAQSTQTATGLVQGSYAVTVTYNGVCSSVFSGITIANTNGPSVTINSTQPDCNAQCNATASATVTGGLTPYVYQWGASAGNATTSSVSGLCAGTHNLSVTDANNCLTVTSVAITEPAALTATATKTNIVCNGNNDGTVSVSASGGTSPYTFSWNTGAGSATITGLAAGVYCVTVTDSKGCTTSVCDTITEPSAITLNTSSVNLICNAQCDGTASVTASGGVSPYTFVWSDSQTNATATGLCAGSFTVTVTDANSCSKTAAINITEPTAITLNITSVSPACGSSNGSLTANASGGTPSVSGYVFQWDAGAGNQNTATATGLSAGNYCVTVTDSLSCSVTVCQALSNPNAPVISFTNVSPLCNGDCNGSATVNVTGGTSPFVFQWGSAAGNSTAQTVTGLCAGNYDVTVTDNIGCVAAAIDALSQPAVLSLSMNKTNVSCNGNNDGMLICLVTGGTSPYSFTWNTGAFTDSIGNLSPANYCVTVTDANGCNQVLCDSISQPSALTLSTSGTNVLCNSQCDGTASVTVSGGTSPYNYLWNDPANQNSDNAINLCAGSYTLTVTDINSCVKTAGVTLSEPSAISSVISSVQPNCTANDGSLTVAASGGVSPYSYIWSNAQTDTTATGLGAGNYCVTITDANNCTNVNCVSLSNVNAPLVTLSVTNISCNGNCNGSISSTVSGGTSPYSYSWSNSESSTTISGLCAGVYILSVTDAAGCLTIVSDTVKQTTALIASMSKTDISCFGQNNGTASVNITGGTSPFVYTWNPSVSSSATASNLSAGVYKVTVTDAGGCSYVDSVSITEPSEIILSVMTTQPITCNGQCNGEASVTASGGVSPYTYSWSTSPVQTNASATGLCAGNYSVTVTDSNSCTETVSVLLSEPSVINATFSSVKPECDSINGSLTAIPSGGLGSTYSFQWDAAAGNQTTATAAGLGAGVYIVTITDSVSCSNAITAVLGNSNGPLITVDSIKNIGCAGDTTGSIFVTASGANSPYTYLWTPGNITTEDLTNVSAGNYSLLVTDSKNCSSSLDTLITQSHSITALLSTVSSTCGNCNGTATVNASGGAGGYSFLWSDGSSQISATATGLCANVYSVTVTDAIGCSSVFTANVGTIGGIDSVLVSSVNVSCFSLCNGSADANVFGGVSPYSYLWSNSKTTKSVSALCAGTYNVTVTDANNCPTVQSVVITEPAAMTATFTSVVPLCQDSNGTITANISGGNSPYSYQWFNNLMVSIAQTTQTATGLKQGIYNVSVTDASGCSAVFNQPLVSNNSIAAIDSIIDVKCFGACDGGIYVTVTGPNPPFTYNWLQLGLTSEDVFDVCAGNYTLEITDSQGCITYQQFTVGSPADLTAQYNKTLATCGQCNGQVVANISGGTSPYNILWYNNDVGTMADSICGGFFSLSVTDANGCSKTFSSAMNNKPGPDSLTVQITPVTCNGGDDGSIIISPFGGITPYTYFWPANTSNITNAASGLLAGNYAVEVTDANGCILADIINVPEPQGIKDSAIVSPTTCGLCDGAINVFASGGAAPYTYLWNAGATTQNITGLCVGVDSLTITDNAGCKKTFAYALSGKDAPVASISITPPKCFASCDGVASVVNTIGGTSPYTYSWSNTATGLTTTGLCKGNYVLSVTDISGCTGVKLFSVSKPDSLFFAVPVVNNVKCNLNCDGMISVVASGGTFPYSYLWNNAQTGSAITSLCAGTYTVTVTDKNACTSTQAITIIEPSPLDVNLSVIDAQCVQSADGSIDATVTGGTLTYTYNWSGPPPFTSSNEDISGLNPGAYTLTVTDANNCQKIVSDSVKTTVEIFVSVMNDTTICEGADTLTLYGSASGTTGLSLSWSINSTVISNTATTVINPLIGTNNYVFEAAKGVCKSSDTVTVTVEITPSANAGSDSEVLKEICSTIGGNPTGPAGYIFTWSPVNGLDNPNVANPFACPKQTTTYYVTVTSPTGCIGIDSVTITVLPEVVINSGFSPNGDGINDGWYIDFANEFPDIVVDIYNRWGQQLFHSVGYQTPWDGKYNGEDLPVGTYYYVILLNHPKFPDPITGPVTLVR
jgi:gliding motility-associated-like protein